MICRFFAGPVASPDDEREHWNRRRLLQQARAGDVGALCILREKYHLRLPLIEQRLRHPMPWMRQGRDPAHGGRRP